MKYYTGIWVIFQILSICFGANVANSGGKFLDDCVKNFVSPSSSDVSLSCRLRTINSEFDKTNFSAISGELVVSLDLQCSDVLFYQSSLQSGSLSHLSRLQSLSIEHCKLSRLPPNVFAGLSILRNLTVNTYNTAWPALSLDIASGVFAQLPSLERIDLSSNNIWTFPDKLFCSAGSLEYLNVSQNRLQDISDLGFREKLTQLPSLSGGGEDQQQQQQQQQTTTRRTPCKLGVQVLDVSSNRLILLPPRGLSGLARLSELHLEGNEISIVADRALSGLKSLKILHLADNKVVALPEDLFQDSIEITEIYLQNNSLSTLPPRLFSKLDQLLVLDLSHNTLSSHWMSLNGSANFNGLIRLVLLNLSYNRLSRLIPNSFQDLYSLQVLNLEHNAIETIEPNTFAAMNNLHTLILSHNKLTFIDSSVFNGLFVLSLLSLDNNALGSVHVQAFHNCSSLKDLNLNGNSFAEIPAALQNLTLLRTVDLGENQIDQIESPKLIGLPDLYGLRLTGNRIVNVSKDALKELPALKVLNLARNRITFVEPGSFDTNFNLQAVRLDANYLTEINNLFADCPNLIWMNISDNHLAWFDYALIPKQLQWLDLHKNEITELNHYYQRGDLRLQTLDASFNKITKISSANIPDSIEMLFLNDNLINLIEPHTFYKKSNLSRVDIFANQIETMDLSALRLTPFPEGKLLPEFYIGGNPIICDCNMEWLQRINKLDHLRQHPKVMDLDSVHCKLVYHRDKYFVPLTEADPAQFLCSYKTHCFALCHCCDFDACDCEMTCPNNCTCFHDDTWSANIVDCANKGHVQVPPRIPMDSTEVYLDGNHFEELNSHMFIGRKNLRVLYLNNSGISRIANNSFSGLKRLSILHLENNYLEELRGYEFEPLESLRELYIQSNSLTFIANNTFVNLRILEVLKLDGNKLTRFSMWTLSSNPYLVEIALNDNPWTCSCDFISQAVPWIQENSAKLMDASGVHCKPQGSSSTGLSLLYMKTNGTKSCYEITALSGAVEGSPGSSSSALPPYLPLLAGVMAICLVIGSLFVAICRKRNSLKIWASSKCPNALAQCYQSALDDEREKLYDAYIAYSVKDENWVTQVLAPELQSQSIQDSCQGPYRLCLHYKDFPVTSYIADTIVEAVESSKRTIIVLSKNFVQSEWCRFEFKSALHAALRGKKNKLIAITLGDLPTRDLDPDLRVCLRSATVLGANDKLFWSKLKSALPEPRASYSATRTLQIQLQHQQQNLHQQQQNLNHTLQHPHLHSLNLSNTHQYNTLNSLTSNNSGGTLSLNGHHTLQCQTSSLSQGHQGGHGTLSRQHSQNSPMTVPLYVPPFPPPNRPPPPFPAPRRPPPPAPLPLWA